MAGALMSSFLMLLFLCGGDALRLRAPATDRRGTVDHRRYEAHWKTTIRDMAAFSHEYDAIVNVSMESPTSSMRQHAETLQLATVVLRTRTRAVRDAMRAARAFVGPDHTVEAHAFQDVQRTIRHTGAAYDGVVTELENLEGVYSALALNRSRVVREILFEADEFAVTEDGTPNADATRVEDQMTEIREAQLTFSPFTNRRMTADTIHLANVVDELVWHLRQTMGAQERAITTSQRARAAAEIPRFQPTASHLSLPGDASLKETWAARGMSEALFKVLVCPITTDVMTDPVVAADGHTYERFAIMEWLKTSDQSPVERVPVAHKALARNWAIRKMLMELAE